MTKTKACIEILDDVVESLRKRKQKFEDMATAATTAGRDMTKEYCNGRAHATTEILNTLTNALHLIRTGRG